MNTTSTIYLKDNILKYPKTRAQERIKISSVVFSFCLNDVVKDKFNLLGALKTLMNLTGGQKPQIIKSKNSIASFKLRKNMEIGGKVTIRGPYNNSSPLINLLCLIFLNLPKLHINNYNISLKNIDLFYTGRVGGPFDQKLVGAHIAINLSKFVSKSNKIFFLSSLQLY
jgi:ribosomal protein L5